MSKTKTTKRALLSSVLAMLLCVTMLIGTTFAWFTDTASTGVNKIQAGNLDVEVEYSVNGTSWYNLQGSNSLFSTNLWEPGHTELVYLRVKNAGNLGFNYKVLVTPVTENGGVNVNGESFKLSDYLVFGTTDPATGLTTYADRAAARTAVAGNGMGLNVNSLTKTGSIQAGGDMQYMSLVVYMPETVGNEANYKTGTTPPTIELGIKVIATQLTAESDSFGDNYDSGAVNDSFYTVGAYYDYFPQVSVSAPVAASGNTVITATGKLNSTDTTATTLAEVTVPVGATLVEGTTELTFNVVPKDPAASTTAGTELVAEIDNPNRETANFDIKVEGIAASNAASIEVKVFVGKGLSNVKVYHNGTLIEGTNYDAATGIVTFSTTSFSDFTAAYDVAVAAIGTQTYGTLALAIAAAQDDDTITLLKDSSGNGIKVPSGSNFAVDFRGFTYKIDGSTVGSTGTETNGFQLLKDSSITFKGGSLTSSKAKILIQNYANLTLDNMNLSASAPCKYVLSNNNGNVIIKDTTITAPEGAVAFDVCRYSSYTGPSVTVNGNSVINGKVEISSSGPKDGATHKLNVTGGTFNGEIKYYNSPDFVGNITGGTFSSDPSAYVAKGYLATESAGSFTVSLCTEHTYQNGVCTKCHEKLVGANSDYNETIPEGANVITTQEALNSALSNSRAGITNTLYVGKGTFSINNVDCDGKTIVFIGAGYDKTELQYGNTPASNVGEAGSNYTFEGSDVTFKDATLKDVNGDNIGYDGFVRVKNMTFDNCLLKSRMTYHGDQKAQFTNCTFENYSDYSIWTYATAKVSFDNCKFMTAGKAILIYHEGYGGNVSNEITVKDCVFTATKGATAGAISNQNCAAIEIDNYGGAVKLTTSGNTVDTANNHFSGEWRIKTCYEGKAIVVNGTTYSKTALDGKLMTVTDRVATFD